MTKPTFLGPAAAAMTKAWIGAGIIGLSLTAQPSIAEESSVIELTQMGYAWNWVTTD